MALILFLLFRLDCSNFGSGHHLTAKKVIGEDVLHEAEEEPARCILQGDKSHEVIAIVGVVPRTCVKLSENHSSRKLPAVRDEQVEWHPDVAWDASFVPQIHIESLD